MNNDLALLKLDVPVQTSDYVRPVCLPESGVDPLDLTGNPAQGNELDVPFCYALGWGNTRGTGFSRILKQLPVRLMNTSQCEKSFDHTFQRSTMLCGRNCAVGGEGPCTADSGGPLVCLHPQTQRWTLYGLISAGTESNGIDTICALPKSGTIFTRISEKVEWIKSIIRHYGR